MNDYSSINKIIENLELMSSALEKSAEKPAIYNTEYGHWLDVISFEIRKQASNLKDNIYYYGDM
jgi:hypothetical protein